MEGPSETASVWAGVELPLGMHIEEAKHLEKKWRLENMIPAWMDYPDEISSSEEEEEEKEDEEDEDGEEGGEHEEYREEEWKKAREEEWRKECEEEWMKASEDYQWVDIDELKLRKKMCIAWIIARIKLKMLEKLDIQQAFKIQEKNFRNLKIQEENPEERERREGIRRAWGEVSAEEKLRAGWKDSERERFSKILSAIWMKTNAELGQTHAMKRQLKEAQENGLQLDVELEKVSKKYLQFRNMWIAIHSCWGGVFEDITQIEPMRYTKGPVPRYVFDYGPPDTLQIFSVKVGGHDGGLRWPLHVFGLIAVRDSIDQHRNVIFNRIRDDCQTLTQEDPYLVLTGPTRAVVMNEESVPVTIEAELKVKSTDGSKDNDLIFAAVALPSEFGSGSIDLAGCMNLKIALGRIMAGVEATIFTRVTEGTWPAGFSGQLAAHTSSMNHREIVLAEFGGDGVPVSDNGDVEQSRRVVSVELFGDLMVSCKAWRCDKMMQDQVSLKAEKKGRSYGTLRVDSCILEVLVVWSPIRPVCEELVSMSEMDFAK